MYCCGVQPFAVHEARDRKAFLLTVAQLIDVGACRPVEIVRTFGVPKRSVLRAVQRYRQGGAAAFFRTRNTRRGGTVFTAPVLAQAQELLDEGMEKTEVAACLEGPPDTLRKALADGRLVVRPRAAAMDKSARSVEDASAATGMGTACTRVVDAGLLEVLRTELCPARSVTFRAALGGRTARAPASLSFHAGFRPGGPQSEFSARCGGSTGSLASRTTNTPANPGPRNGSPSKPFPCPAGNPSPCPWRSGAVEWVHHLIPCGCARSASLPRADIKSAYMAFEVEHTALAAGLFWRWCQENFFRDTMEHFASDKLAEYGRGTVA